MKKKAFTLIELLVVIAILVILASLALPLVLGKSTRLKRAPGDQENQQYKQVDEQPVEDQFK